MARLRGRRPRSADAAGYLEWRKAEDAAARANEPWAGRVDAVAGWGADEPLPEAMHEEPVTVTRWRRTIPTVETWRAWLHEAYDRFDGMPEWIDRGDFDAIAATPDTAPRTQADYLADVVPKLDRGLAAVRGRRPTTAELARLLGVSRRTVGRYRTK